MPQFRSGTAGVGRKANSLLGQRIAPTLTPALRPHRSVADPEPQVARCR